MQNFFHREIQFEDHTTPDQSGDHDVMNEEELTQVRSLSSVSDFNDETDNIDDDEFTEVSSVASDVGNISIFDDELDSAILEAELEINDTEEFLQHYFPEYEDKDGVQKVVKKCSSSSSITEKVEIGIEWGKYLIGFKVVNTGPPIGLSESNSALKSMTSICWNIFCSKLSI